MVDLDQRVADGLREFAGRAPVDADVWAVTETHVVRRRRRRHAIAGGVVLVALVGAAVASFAVIRAGDSKPVVSDRGSTTVPVPVLPASGPIEEVLKITASPTGGLTFYPDSITVTTGVYAVELRGGSNAEHTLEFDDPATLSSQLSVDTFGEPTTMRVFFGQPGDYTFFCSVPGHRAAGMSGVVHVTGPPMSLSEALAAAGP